MRGRVLSIDGLQGIDALCGIGSSRAFRSQIGAPAPDGGTYVDDANPDDLQPGKDKGPVVQWPGALTPDGRYWVAVPESPTGWGYRVHEGFTLAGWTITYMGDPYRTQEVWNYQPAEVKTKFTMSNIKVGTVLWAPPDAVKNARTRKLIPGELADEVRKLGGWKAVAAVGAGVLTIGGIIWAIARAKG